MTFLYFDPNVWGTVSDWCMIVVTIMTAIYLYKTLQSQQEVQRIQNELYKIESIKFNESIKPILKYNLIQGRTMMENQSFFIIDIINESNSSALKITIESSETENVKRKRMHRKHSTHLQKGDEPLKLYFYVINNSIFNNIITISVDYEDITGVKYNQNVVCNLIPGISTINPYLATLVK